MRRILLLGALVACRSAPSQPEPMPKSSDPVQVTWQMTRSGDALAVSYEVANGSAAPIYLLDQPVVADGDRWKVLADRSYVQRGGRPHLASFARGYLDSQSQLPEVEQDDHDTIFPAIRTVAPGAKLAGAFQVPLPIEPWRPGLELAGLKDPREAVLEIGYVTTDGPWDQLPAASGTIRTATRITAKSQRWARGPEQKIP